MFTWMLRLQDLLQEIDSIYSISTFNNSSYFAVVSTLHTFVLSWTFFLCITSYMNLSEHLDHNLCDIQYNHDLITKIHVCKVLGKRILIHNVHSHSLNCWNYIARILEYIRKAMCFSYIWWGRDSFSQGMCLKLNKRWKSILPTIPIGMRGNLVVPFKAWNSFLQNNITLTFSINPN